MRIWLLALAGCWTAPPVEPTTTPHVAHARPQTIPGGYFVPNLVTRRLETNAFDDGFAGLAGVPAALPVDTLTRGSPMPPPRQLVAPRGVMSRFTIGVDQTDPRAVVQYCIDISGRVTSAHVELRDDGQARPLLLQLPSDRDVLEKMRGWRFAPYFVAGKPVTACSFIDYAAL